MYQIQFISDTKFNMGSHKLEFWDQIKEPPKRKGPENFSFTNIGTCHIDLAGETT